MRLTCVTCGRSFRDHPVILGKERHLHGRRQCLQCLPFRPRRSPSVIVSHPPKTLTCQNCGRTFPAKVRIGDKVRSLYRRRFCLECSPFGIHNSSRHPPGNLSALELAEHRRRRRNEKIYRYQKKRRRGLKAQLVAARGGKCEDCGYDEHIGSLEFHHLDPATKEFAISAYVARLGTARLAAEVAKCVLVCASCHRLRHLALGRPTVDAVVVFRRRQKARAVTFMGSICAGCGRDGPPALFEFHHRNAAEKDFGLSESGIPRRWERVVSELAKCVMLCANCHREVHAGVRWIDDGLLGLAEPAAGYAA